MKHSDFCCFKRVTYVFLTLCFKLRSFFTLIFAVLSISNVTIVNIKCSFLLSVHFFCHGNTLLTVFSISEFSDPKHIL